MSDLDRSLPDLVRARPTDRLEDGFENATNGSLRIAISTGSMKPVDGVHGETFVARCGAGEVRFRFARAMVGVYNSVFGTPQVGAYVSIHAAAHDCSVHTRLRLVQVCREIVPRGAMMVSARPRDQFRADRSGYNNREARSLGWRVDQSVGHTSVYWTDAGRRDGRDGSSLAPARLLDAPASLPDAETGRPVAGVGKEFRTCVISSGLVLACVEWGYYIDQHFVVGMYPAGPIAYANARDEVYDAIDRWDRTPGHSPSGIVTASELGRASLR